MKAIPSPKGERSTEAQANTFTDNYLSLPASAPSSASSSFVLPSSTKVKPVHTARLLFKSKCNESRNKLQKIACNTAVLIVSKKKQTNI